VLPQAVISKDKAVKKRCKRAIEPRIARRPDDVNSLIFHASEESATPIECAERAAAGCRAALLRYL